jgi:hypothetical protein
MLAARFASCDGGGQTTAVLSGELRLGGTRGLWTELLLWKPSNDSIEVQEFESNAELKERLEQHAPAFLAGKRHCEAPKRA